MNSSLVSSKIPFRIQLFILITLLVTAVFSEGFHRGDEHYQLLEFANYVLNNLSAEDLCWEFGAQIRPSAQPYIALSVIHFLKFLGITNPHNWALVLRLITAFLSFLAIKHSYVYLSKYVGNKSMLYFLSGLLWFVVYVSVRFSSETWSALFFMFSLTFYFRSKTFFSLLLAGVFAGLSFEFRYQTALMSLGFFVWLILIQKESFKSILSMILGFVLVVVCCTVLDAVFYGEFVFAPYNYFYTNLIADKVSSFGVDPWYHYIPDLLNKTYVVYGVLILLGMILLLIKKPKSFINYIVLPFVLFHFLVGHKEMRFMYPVIYFSGFYICFSAEFLLGFLSKFKGVVFKPVKYMHVVLSGLLLICTVFFSYKGFVKVRGWMSRNATGKDILYVIENNPYDRKGMPFNFYNMAHQPRVIEIKNTSEIKKNNEGSVFLFTSVRDNDRGYEVPNTSVLIFQSAPVILTTVFNFNNWVGRTTIEKLYKIENKSE